VDTAFVAALSQRRGGEERGEESCGDERAQVHRFPLLSLAPGFGVGLVEGCLAVFLADVFFGATDVVSLAAAAIERGSALSGFFADLVLETIVSFGAAAVTGVLPRNT
jgi:hypothetical protein